MTSSGSYPPDIVLGPFEVDVAILPDCVSRGRILVSRLTYTAGVDDLRETGTKVTRQMSMTNKEVVRLAHTFDLQT